MGHWLHWKTAILDVCWNWWQGCCSLWTKEAWYWWLWPWRPWPVQRTQLVIPLSWLSCQMRGACQTLQGHTKKRQVTLMPKSLRMPCQLGGPRFLMPPRVALAAWCLWKLGRTISSATFTRQVSSAMAPLAFAAASWRMAMPNAVQLQTQALVQPRSLTYPSWKALGSIKQDRQAAFARDSFTSAPIATSTATSTAATMEREL